LRSPATAAQLRDRPEALHAALLLDPEKRARVEAFLVERLNDAELDDEHRVDVALLAVDLGGLSSASRLRVAETLVQGLDRVVDAGRAQALADGLAGLLDGAAMKEAPGLWHRAAQNLLQAMTRITDDISLQSLQLTFQAVCGVDPAGANH